MSEENMDSTRLDEDAEAVRRMAAIAKDRGGEYHAASVDLRPRRGEPSYAVAYMVDGASGVSVFFSDSQAAAVEALEVALDSSPSVRPSLIELRVWFPTADAETTALRSRLFDCEEALTVAREEIVALGGGSGRAGELEQRLGKLVHLLDEKGYSVEFDGDEVRLVDREEEDDKEVLAAIQDEEGPPAGKSQAEISRQMKLATLRERAAKADSVEAELEKTSAALQSSKAASERQARLFGAMLNALSERGVVCTEEEGGRVSVELPESRGAGSANVPVGQDAIGEIYAKAFRRISKIVAKTSRRALKRAGHGNH